VVAGVMPIDLTRLAGWMDDVGLPRGTIEQATQLGGGSQNILIRFERAGATYVLRRPPLHKRAESDETMRREARVLTALVDSAVPHPRLIAACPDVDVLGAAFYLTELVDGRNPTLGLPDKYRSDAAWRHGLGLAMSDGAAAIAGVDHVALGLDDLGHSEGFLERQVQRWWAQLESYAAMSGYPGHALPGISTVAEWLERNLPTDWKPGLIHGDYHFANVLCRTDRPELAAIVDWELATSGDPLLDLGWLLATWPAVDTPVPILRLDPWDGFPTRGELVARYAERSSRDLSTLDWYEVLACYKLGIILEGTHARACAGKAPQATGDQLHASAIALSQRGLALIGASEA
jgi:aminoglycoside phosphotransferase (APT) family kinase protein